MIQASFVLALLLTAPVVLAGHHSTAMFDREKRMTLTGVVKEFQWTNPHAWIQIEAPGSDGKIGDWAIECNSPNTLSRIGWKASSLKPGDKVVALINPMKDGTNAGLLISVTLADGRVLAMDGAPAQPAQGGR